MYMKMDRPSVAVAKSSMGVAVLTAEGTSILFMFPSCSVQNQDVATNRHNAHAHKEAQHEGCHRERQPVRA